MTKEKYKLINALCKIFNTIYIDINTINEDELKKQILNTRYNANKIFFINASDNDIDKYINFYKMQDLTLSINISDYDSECYGTINLKGTFTENFIEAINAIKNLI